MSLVGLFNPPAGLPTPSLEEFPHLFAVSPNLQPPLNPTLVSLISGRFFMFSTSCERPLGDVFSRSCSNRADQIRCK